MTPAAAQSQRACAAPSAGSRTRSRPVCRSAPQTQQRRSLRSKSTRRSRTAARRDRSEHGAKRTRSADSHQAGCAQVRDPAGEPAPPVRDTSASGTTAIPAICATPINGMARKFNAESGERDARERQRADREQQRLGGDRRSEHRPAARTANRGERETAEISLALRRLRARVARSHDRDDHEDRQASRRRSARTPDRRRSADLARPGCAATSANALSGGLR